MPPFLLVSCLRSHSTPTVLQLEPARGSSNVEAHVLLRAWAWLFPRPGTPFPTDLTPSPSRPLLERCLMKNPSPGQPTERSHTSLLPARLCLRCNPPGFVRLFPLNVDPRRPDVSSLARCRTLCAQNRARQVEITRHVSAGCSQSPGTYSNCLTKQYPNSDTRLDFIRKRKNRRTEMNLRGHCSIHRNHSRSYYRSSPTHRTEPGIHTSNKVPGDLPASQERGPRTQSNPP